MNQNYSNRRFLEQWISACDGVLRNHRRYVLGPTLRNLILHGYALIEDKQTVARNRESVETSKVLRWLDKKLNQNGYEQEIINKNHPLAGLKATFLIEPSGNANQYDSAAIKAELSPLALKLENGEMLNWMIADLRERIASMSQI